MFIRCSPGSGKSFKPVISWGPEQLSVQPIFDTRQASPLFVAANDSEAANGLRVLSLTQIGRAAWDAFVYREPTATFFHLSGWQKIVESVYGYDTYYLAAASANRIAGVLPLVHVRSRLFGSALISNAFCVYGGIASDNPNAVHSLAEAALALGQRLGVSYVELRSQKGTVPDWPVKGGTYATFQRPLSAKDDENLKAIPRKKRADVRKAIKADLPVDTSGDVDAFYSVYAESVRNLGTPVFAKKFLTAIQSEFADQCEISVIRGPDGPAAALTSFFFRDQVLPYYGGGVAGARRLHAYDYLYWTLMQRAAARGARVFDFGRSKYGTGAFNYKTFWGFEPEPLEYQYGLTGASGIPDINPLNPKYRLMVAAWQKLPLSAANLIGPWISRQLG